ncbi:MAG: glucarate dehydratase, partial [Beijerinckiaceae bacterium]
MRVTGVTITPVAVPDLPLVNCKGVHPNVFLRSIIELETDTGLIGLGEGYGAARTLTGLRKTADALLGLNPFHLNDLKARVLAALPEGGGVNAPTAVIDHKLVDVVFSAFEVACMDLQAKSLGIPMHALLGGKVRDTVGFSAYLFFKFAGLGDGAADPWGEVMTPDALV